MPRDEEERDARRMRRWWRDMSGEDASAEPGPAEDMHDHLRQFRPPWWPENEPWPPSRRRWRGPMHRPFLRRFGFLFLLFNLLVAGFIVSIIFLVLNALGLTSAPVHQALWPRPVAILVVAVMISAMVYAVRSVRRMSMPLDELLNASHRLADGDYSVRVTPRGPGEVRGLAAAFNSMAEQLEAHERSRRSMLADVTHELRTPLTVIQGNLEGMLDGMYAADETRLRSILEETQILARLTEDLRTLSLAESGPLQLRREPTDLAALARDTIAAQQSPADEAKVHIDLHAPEGELVQEVDPERIRQVLTNLISNAVRYSPPGSAVRVDITRNGNTTRFAVVDSGPGIASGDLPHVFDRYYKSADSRGMGLGLAIARYLVEAHGGQIQAASEPGRGTTIWFTLPG